MAVSAVNADRAVIDFACEPLRRVRLQLLKGGSDEARRKRLGVDVEQKIRALRGRRLFRR